MSPRLVPTPVASYWRDARRHRYSLLFALPLLVLYEALAASLDGGRGTGVRNGADVLLKELFLVTLGRWGAPAFGVLLIGGSLFLVARDLRAGGGLRARVFLGMAAESVGLALVFGLAVSVVTTRLLHPLAPLATRLPSMLAQQAATGAPATLGWWTQLMVSLGAGLYEELLFRVILVAALGQLARRLFGWRPFASGAFATLAGALVFSAFHYVGAYGDTFTVRSFAFRAVAGVFFSALYLTRGFGVTAWTHALYDVFLLVL